MGVRNPNSTDYVHPDEPNLLNLHKAMTYDPVSGEPHLRVFLGTDTITINGEVNLVDNVRINNTDGQSIPVHLTDDPITVNQGTSPWVVSGNVSGNVVVTSGNINSTVTGNVVITSIPAITGNVNANVSGNVIISGNANIVNTPNVYVTNTPDITGNVAVSGIVNANVTGNVVVTSGNINSNVTGNVVVTSIPAITGNVNANVSGNVVISGNANIINTPNVHVTNTPDVTGNVSISSLPSITGNVNANVSGNVVVSSGNINANVTQGTSPWVVQGNVTVNQDANTPSLVKYINTSNNLQMDMTQRLRVSPPLQSWWYAPTVDKDGDLRYIESNVGANSGSIFVQNLASINMSPGTDANGSFIRISRRRHKMRPGASMSLAFSINWNGYVPDGKVTKRVGLFTSYNGVFYEMTDDLQVVIRRRLTDGTLVEKRVTRADFNIDKLDGTGESGYDLRPVVLNTANLTAYVSKTAVPITGDGTVYRVVFTVSDPTQFYISQKGRITGVSPTLYNGTVMVTAISGNNVTFVYNIDPGSFSSLSSATFVHTAYHNQFTWGFDFNGNRSTSVRFFIDGPLGRVGIHQENFGGELSSPFASAPAVSTRYEIFNNDAPGRLPNFTCSSEVINVEAELELNPGFGVATNNTPVVYPKGGTATHPILGIALRAGEPYQRSDLQLQAVTFADIANINQQNSGVFYWRLVLNPTLGGTVPASSDVGKSTRMWKYTAATTITGGTDLISGYAQSTQQFDVRTALNFVNLGSNIEYTDSDKIVLVVQQLVGGTSDAQLVATINFIEAL